MPWPIACWRRQARASRRSGPAKCCGQPRQRHQPARQPGARLAPAWRVRPRFWPLLGFGADRLRRRRVNQARRTGQWRDTNRPPQLRPGRHATRTTPAEGDKTDFIVRMSWGASPCRRWPANASDHRSSGRVPHDTMPHEVFVLANRNQPREPGRNSSPNQIRSAPSHPLKPRMVVHSTTKACHHSRAGGLSTPSP
jgi:hypothetical protein